MICYSLPLSGEIINQEMAPNTQVVMGEEDHKNSSRLIICSSLCSLLHSVLTSLKLTSALVLELDHSSI